MCIISFFNYYKKCSTIYKCIIIKISVNNYLYNLFLNVDMYIMKNEL